MASKTDAFDVAETTALCRFREGRAKEFNGLEEYWWKEGVSLA
jgi:hypothetical protein